MNKEEYIIETFEDILKILPNIHENKEVLLKIKALIHRNNSKLLRVGKKKVFPNTFTPEKTVGYILDSFFNRDKVKA